jgi:hypothetical protein
MLYIISSTAAVPNQGFVEMVRKEGEDNVSWLARNQPQDDGALIVMVGGKSQTAFRLRSAQAHIRHDLIPSSWSHAMLLGNLAKNPASTPVYEIALEGENGFGFPPPTNAVQKGKFGQYRDPGAYPNIAVLKVPVEKKDVMKALERFQMQRAVLDAVDLVVRWLAFAWGIGQSINPLLENHGIPSAAMLEVVFGAVGYDLTPGLESRSSCPEAIWQAAKWWHEFYEKQNRPYLSGAYCVAHRLT